MQDFRSEIYHRYISSFKTEILLNSTLDLDSYWKWCKFKFSPLLKNMSSEDNILEIGCGPGYILDFLRQNGFSRVKGIDISSEQIKIAEDKGFDVQVIDVYDYFKTVDEKYSAVFAINILEHFTKNELFQLLPLIYNALKKDSKLIIQVPNGQGLFPNQIIFGDITHLTIFTPALLEQLLKCSGFNNFEFYETGPVAKNIRGLVRLYLWRFIKILANFVRLLETGKTQKIWTEAFICCCQK